MLGRLRRDTPPVAFPEVCFLAKRLALVIGLLQGLVPDVDESVMHHISKLVRVSHTEHAFAHVDLRTGRKLHHDLEKEGIVFIFPFRVLRHGVDFRVGLTLAEPLSSIVAPATWKGVSPSRLINCTAHTFAAGAIPSTNHSNTVRYTSLDLICLLQCVEDVLNERSTQPHHLSKVVVAIRKVRPLVFIVSFEPVEGLQYAVFGLIRCDVGESGIFV